MKNVFIFLILAFILTSIHLAFIDEPFERDEGGYAYIGKCLLEGQVLYKDVWELMPPGLPFIYALIFKLYGVNFYSVRIFTILWALIGLLFFLALTNRLYGRKTAVISGILYSIFSSLPVIQGSSSNTEPFMIVFLIAGLYFFILSEKTQGTSLIFSGIAIGLASIIKQSALLNLFVLLLFIPCYGRGLASVILLILGFFISWIPFVLYIAKHDLWNDFVYTYVGWHFTEGMSFLNPGFFYKLFMSILFIMKENSILWYLSITAIISIFLNNRIKQNILIVLWTIFSFFGVCLGGAFYPHYYIQVIPPLCLLSGWCLVNIFMGIKERQYWRKPANVFSIIAIIILLAFIIRYEYRFFFVFTPDEVSIAKYRSQMFVIAKETAKHIEETTKPDDAIFVWGMEPEIYFYSNRKCPSRFIHNYCLIGDYEFAKNGRLEIMRDIKLKKPKVIVKAYPFDKFPELKEYADKYYEGADYKGLIIYKIK